MDGQLIEISLTNEGKSYNIKIAAGASFSEVMFAMSVLIKACVRDGVIENHTIATDMLNKYLTDSQYDELSN